MQILEVSKIKMKQVCKERFQIPENNKNSYEREYEEKSLDTDQLDPLQ